MTLSPTVLRRVVAAALEEDLGGPGDITSDCVVTDGASAVGHIVARQDLVLAGLPVAREVYRALDPAVEFTGLHEDGERISRGSPVARVCGSARAVLRGERTALNVLMRMCGIATAARSAVEEIEGTQARILDTRKTGPGLRMLDKYAVAAGGALNHRLGLYDAVMIKDTHLQIVPSIGVAVRRALEAGHPAALITVEVRDLDQFREAIDAGAGRALLDNMDLATTAEAVRLADGRIVLEASGGLRPGNLRPVAETGVDYLSLGWLTHSAPAADLAMELEGRS
jgi:nicotinate-nucleotide pyrophosphorylase (carboxylating)